MSSQSFLIHPHVPSLTVLRIEPANKLIREYQKTLNQFIEQSKKSKFLQSLFAHHLLEKYEAKNGDDEDDEEEDDDDDEEDDDDDDGEEEESEGETESKG
jgi:hypothetical protein